MTWSARLQSALTAKGWSKAELSRRSTVPYDSINKYLRGDIEQPRGDTLEKLADALEVDRLWLKEGVRGPITRGADVEGFTPADLARLPIRGEVAAGRWLETPALLQLSEITDFVEGLAIPALSGGMDLWPSGARHVAEQAGRRERHPRLPRRHVGDRVRAPGSRDRRARARPGRATGSHGQAPHSPRRRESNSLSSPVGDFSGFIFTDPLAIPQIWI